MNKEAAKEQIERLSASIREYNKSYYAEDNPTISDAQYDLLFNQLLKLEKEFPELITKYSPTQNVGNAASDKFEKFQHKIPMLSLANGFSSEDIKDFIDKICRFLKTDNTPFLYLEPKIDGMSFSMTYERGKLIAAATRGDGYIGEDITRNVKTIKNIPLEIKNAPELLEVRGEIFIEKTDFVFP